VNWAFESVEDAIEAIALQSRFKLDHDFFLEHVDKSLGCVAQTRKANRFTIE
jgi:hypothetical protein